MNYIDTIAKDIRARVPAKVLPSGDTILLFRLYALLARSKGMAVSASDVHDAWCVWMSTKDPAHPSIRPFDDLDAETRREDEPFVTAIRQAATGDYALGDC
jgi:hypothetical protein